MTPWRPISISPRRSRKAKGLGRRPPSLAIGPWRGRRPGGSPDRGSGDREKAWPRSQRNASGAAFFTSISRSTGAHLPDVLASRRSKRSASPSASKRRRRRRRRNLCAPKPKSAAACSQLNPAASQRLKMPINLSMRYNLSGFGPAHYKTPKGWEFTGQIVRCPNWT